MPVGSGLAALRQPSLSCFPKMKSERIVTQEIAIFGESGSGKTVLASCF
jgi:ABC-type dipeptide/oligopeptide/nickel transport system ATPase subunit